MLGPKSLSLYDCVLLRKLGRLTQQALADLPFRSLLLHPYCEKRLDSLPQTGADSPALQFTALSLL